MFNEPLLNFIQRAARNTKNQGELAVPRYMAEVNINKFFTDEQWNIVNFCAEECKRQRSGEMSVYDMVNAWDYASKDEDFLLEEETLHLTIKFIERIGTLIEPIDNKKGIRTIPIGVGDGTPFGWIEKAKYYEIPRKLEHLIAAYYDPDAPLESMTQGKGLYAKANSAEDVFYLEYEEIHPFKDGNGRSGKIFYNYLKGTLDNPVMPPNFWGSSNP